MKEHSLIISLVAKKKAQALKYTMQFGRGPNFCGPEIFRS